MSTNATKRTEKRERAEELDKFDQLLKEANENIVASIDDDDAELQATVKKFLERKTCTCPFCGTEPSRDLNRTGMSVKEVNKLRESPEYEEDKTYRSLVEDLIAKDTLTITFRIMCRSKDCLFPNTGWAETIKEAFKKWERRAN